MIHAQQLHDLLPGILFTPDRCHQSFFDIIIDHRLSQQLVARRALALGERAVEQREHLIHIQIELRDVRRCDVAVGKYRVYGLFQPWHRVHLFDID